MSEIRADRVDLDRGGRRRVAGERERPWKGISFLITEPAGLAFVGDLAHVPYRQPDGTIHNRRVLAPSGRCWWETSGLELIPFGLETIPPASECAQRALLIAEGESDTLALREAFAGVTPDSPVRGYDVLGLPGATTWRAEWRIYVEPYDLVYLIGDGDAAGRKMIDDVHRDIPWSRPVWLPEGTDAREILQKHGPRSLDPLLDRADETAKLCAAFMIARDYDEFIRLLRGEEVHIELAA